MHYYYYYLGLAWLSVPSVASYIIFVKNSVLLLINALFTGIHQGKIDVLYVAHRQEQTLTIGYNFSCLAVSVCNK